MTSAARITGVLIVCLLFWQSARIVFAQTDPPPAPTLYQITLTVGYTFEVDEVWKQGDEIWYRKGGISRALPASSVKKFGKSVSVSNAVPPAKPKTPEQPLAIWIYLNGHEWAKRQCDKAGIGYEALDNGFRSCDDPTRLQRICDRLGSGAVHSFFWRWCHRLPSPFTRSDLRHGYTYQLAFRQFEVSDTRVFDRPQAGRTFFEGLIRDHLDVGRPDQVAIIFDRRINSCTPGTFRTKVITRGVDPQLCCYYRSARLKQYFKEHRALRTELVISDTRDFGIGRRVTAENWKALRAVGEAANRRLCDAQASDAVPAPDVVTFAHVTCTSDTPDGLHVPGLRFGDKRVMAVMSAAIGFGHLLAGFDNQQLTRLAATLLDQPYTARQATYDLRRLRRKGLIERFPHSNRYQLTPLGRQVMVLFTKTYGRVLAPGLVQLDPHLPPDLAARSPLATAWRRLDHALDNYISCQIAAA